MISFKSFQAFDEEDEDDDGWWISFPISDDKMTMVDDLDVAAREHYGSW